MKREDICKYIGDISQLSYIRQVELKDGKSKGVRIVELRNADGIEMDVVADRCLDISHLSYKGNNISFISKTGIVAPEYYEADDNGWLWNFYAGFLTTCGLSNVGLPSEADGNRYGLHGRISNTPVEELCYSSDWDEDDIIYSVSGRMRQGRLFSENLMLTRTIVNGMNSNSFDIYDEIENIGFKEEPLFILYHFNLGYPFLCEDCTVDIPTLEVKPRTEEAKKDINTYNIITKPAKEYKEKVFYHKMKADEDGNTAVKVYNKRLKFGICIRYNINELNNFIQWKMLGNGEYAMGLEPANCYLGGRKSEIENGTAEYLKPFEKKNIHISVEFYT